MSGIEKYTIYQFSSILDALRKIDSNSSDAILPLFVIDHSGCLVGSATEGDIRRGIIKGLSLNDSIEQVMNRKFTYLTAGIYDIEKIRYIKERQFKLVPILDITGKVLQILSFKDKRSYLPITAVLMAGGKGERLRPLTEKVPKPLLPVGEKAIIDYNVDNLIDFGVEDIFVTINYLGEQIEEHFKEKRVGVQIQCIKEKEYSGTISSVKLVTSIYNDDVLVMNSDLFTNIDFEDFYLHFKEKDADMSVVAIPYSINIPYGIFDLDGRNIRGIKEKPTYDYYANAGIYLIKRELLDLIPDKTFFNATDLIYLLISQNKNVIRYPLVGYWIDIGKHEDYKRAIDFAKHIK